MALALEQRQDASRLGELVDSHVDFHDTTENDEPLREQEQELGGGRVAIEAEQVKLGAFFNVKGIADVADVVLRGVQVREQRGIHIDRSAHYLVIR